MSFLERINNKLTEKNKAAAERPPNSELVLLLGKREMEAAEQMYYSVTYAKGFIPKIEDDGKALKTIGGQKYLFEMLVIPVDLDEYLDIVRKI